MSTTRERYLQWKHRLSLPQFPIEIWTKIFSYLHVTDLCSIRLVSRLFYACVNQHTDFWSNTIFDLDLAVQPHISERSLCHIRLSKIDLLCQTNRYAHCSIYINAQPLTNDQRSFKSRRRRRFFDSSHSTDEPQSHRYLRCVSVHFASLKLFDQSQLHYLLIRRVRSLSFVHEFTMNEPSMHFLFKLARLKSLEITFRHNIETIDAYSQVLVDAMEHSVSVILQMIRYAHWF
jgi:hypothetical protein